jgi:hypothetical protein
MAAMGSAAQGWGFVIVDVCCACTGCAFTASISFDAILFVRQQHLFRFKVQQGNLFSDFPKAVTIISHFKSPFASVKLAA